jgi:60 kDa SS-A/Ro ribonucleoprotein
MANPTLFRSLVGRLLPVARGWNHEAAPAYEMPPAHALAQYAATGPLALLNQRGARGTLVVIVSDNESWVDARPGRATATLDEWSRFKARNPDARLVLIDLQPGSTTQAVERDDVLNVGGFSDQVFEIVAEFAAGRLRSGHWVERINQVTL